MKNRKFNSFPLPTIPLIRKNPSIEKGAIVFTNDGTDDINSEPQTDPPITMQLIMCDDTEAKNLREQFYDLFEYGEILPYIDENFPAIFAGKDPNWVLSDIQIEPNNIDLGLTARQSDGDDHATVINLHLTGGTDSFIAFFQCQGRALLVQQFYNAETNCYSTVVFRFRNDRPVSVATAVSHCQQWEVFDLF